MSEFSTYRAFYEFSLHIRSKSRYVLDSNAKQFLEAVLASSSGRKQVLKNNSNLWRAQEGHDWRTIRQHDDEFDIPSPHKQERMKPIKCKATEGRANPKGIPSLYLGTDKETAMAEVRPSLGSYVSVGQFKLLKEISLIDCSVGHASGISIYFDEPDAKKRERAVWNDIDRAFSEPIIAGDLSADYAPTQILAELFKNEGYDGIVYKSNLGKGFNICLFNLELADIVNCFLYKAKSVEYKFTEEAEPYFVKKYYDQKETK